MRSVFGRVPLLFAFILLVNETFAQTGVMTTVAGTGIAGYAGDDGPATAAQVNAPYGVAVDGAGNLYIADSLNNRIRKVSFPTGLITTVAGRSGDVSFSGDGGPATLAYISHPEDVAVDTAGNVYIADSFNNRVRKISSTTGLIETIAGTTEVGYNGEGPAVSADLNDPAGVAVDSHGNVYIADHASHRIRKVTAATGLISTVAGTGTGGFGGDQGPATAAQLYFPTHIAIDSSDNIYIVDSQNHRIRKVTAATGIISTIAGNGNTGFSGDGGPATAARLSDPYDVAVDSAGNVFVADTINGRVRYIDATTGIIATVAGGGPNTGNCPALTSSLQFPIAVKLDQTGSRIYIADYADNRVRTVALTDTLSRPNLTSITPSSGFRQTSSAVTLTGSGFSRISSANPDCRPGVTSVSVSRAGITASGVNVVSDTSATATLVIAPDAALGPYNVTVSTEQGTSNGIQFTVIEPVPLLTSITPASGLRGSTTNVTLSGSGFDITPGSTRVVVNGSGILINNVNVTSPTSLTASFAIAANAPLDDQSVAVVTAGGTSNAVTFSVNPQVVEIAYAMPQLLNPTEQVPVKIMLGSSSSDTITGQLTVTFVPNANNNADDPGVSLINPQMSARTAAFTFLPNSAEVQFSSPGILLRAGTVAGTIRLTISETKIGTKDLPVSSSTFDITVPRQVPVITNVRVLNKKPVGFDVEVAGYSTSRDIIAATFQFGRTAGANLQTPELRLNMSEAFAAYYQSTAATVGSTFVYTQPFILQGDANAIDSITVILSNAQGDSLPSVAH